jgi:hypothetical protein
MQEPVGRAQRSLLSGVNFGVSRFAKMTMSQGWLGSSVGTLHDTYGRTQGNGRAKEPKRHGYFYQAPKLQDARQPLSGVWSPTSRKRRETDLARKRSDESRRSIRGPGLGDGEKLFGTFGVRTAHGWAKGLFFVVGAGRAERPRGWPLKTRTATSRPEQLDLR